MTARERPAAALEDRVLGVERERDEGQEAARGVLQVAQPQPGFNLLLTAVAAVVVGGASLTGGIGGIGGTAVGVALLAVLSNGLNVLTVAPFIQNLVLGVVIIGAVLLNDAVGAKLRRG